MILLFVGFLILILSFSFPKEKIICMATLVYMYILMAGQYGHADYYLSEVAYYNCFNKSIIGEDPLYNIIERLFNFFGFSYEFFIAVLTFVALLLLAKFIFKYTSNPGFVLGCTIIMPFVIDIVEYNNFIGMVIVLYATQYLIQGSEDIKKAIILLIIAVGICSYTIVYLVFLLIPRLSIKQIILFVSVAFAIILTGGNLVYAIAINFVNSDKVDVYFNREVKQSTAFLLGMLILIGVVMVVLSYLMLKKSIANMDKRNRQLEIQNFSVMVVKANILMILSIAIQFYTLEAARFYQNILILNYMMFSFFDLFSQREGKLYLRLKGTLFKISVIALACIYFYIYCVYWNYSTVFEPVFFNNRFISFFTNL